MRPVPVPISTKRPSGRSAERAIDRAFDLAFGDVERADLVPDLGMAGEIAVGRFGALGANGFGPRRIGGEPAPAVGCVRPIVDKREQGLDPIGLRERQEHPAAFLAALEHSRVGENLEVARHARLALPEHLRQFADRQLHHPQQRQDAQPGRIGKRLETIGKRES